VECLIQLNRVVVVNLAAVELEHAFTLTRLRLVRAELRSFAALWTLAKIAGVAEPDSIESPGARFLLAVVNTVADADAPEDEKERDEWMGELAGSRGPVYTRA
jgi:hypothetical protein